MTGVNGTLFVSGYGEELVEPDECKVMVTITSERATARQAQNASAETFDAIMNALSAANIESEIETIFFNVEKPRYYDSTKKTYIVQDFFRATHNLTVKVRAKEAGDTAQTCTSNESSVSGVHFQLGKELEQSSRDKALTKAVKLAKEKAKLLAKSAGVELGTLQSLVDRAQSMTINAPADTDYEILADATPAISARSREPHYELNFAIRKISVYESVQLAYTTI
jgi:uncharacterized protein YggE